MLLICFGTRPEWLKVKPLTKVLKNYKLLFTGQHPDLLKDVDVDYSIDMTDSNNRLDGVVSDCLSQFPDGDFDSVLVQGDTASAFACAVAAFHRKLKIYYLEAGLRTYDLDHPYPEEGYRQMISRLANVCFCPTEMSNENLIDESIYSKRYVTGNTVLDNLTPYKKDCEYEDKVLVTLHRRENHEQMDSWFRAVNAVAKTYDHLNFILPIHPNPNVQKHKHLLSHVDVVNPLEYEDLLNILVKTKFVITDSGGLQEEGSFFNKKVIVCRTTTERPEGIETGHLVMCKKPKDLKDIVKSVLQNPIIDEVCPYGDGKSSQRIAKVLE
jgi:UDP-N-acetylglucosamine 2-epimerase (non-hydrolysing)|tara:strand:- start:2447 stop:3421 length:975 start_codon:yes stop_codon:yes gene_type:complete